MNSGGTMVNIVFLFLELAIAARLLSAESLGIYVLLITAVNFLVIALDFGLKNALTQLIASSDWVRQSALVNTALLFRFAVIVVLSVFIWLVQSLSFLHELLPLLQHAHYIPFMLLTASADELLGGMLRGFQAYRHMVVAQVVRSVLRLALTAVLLIVVDLGVMALVYSWTISFAVATIYQYLALPTTRSWSYERSLLTEMLRFGLPLQVSNFLLFMANNSQIFLLGILAGPASAAYYAIATRIPVAFSRLSEAYISVFFPRMTALLSNKERAQAEWMLHQSVRLTSFAVALGALTAAVFSQEIVVLLFSKEYAVAAPAFAVLMISFHMFFIVSQMGYTLLSIGHPEHALIVNTLRAGMSLLGAILLIPNYGFMGAAYATFLTAYAANPVSILLLRRSNITMPVPSYAKQTALLLFFTTLFLWLQPISIVHKMAMIILFVMFNLLLRTISPDDLRWIVPKALAKHGTAGASKRVDEVA